MDEPACPRCKTTKYRNPSLKLMVNVCGHTLCENCVDLLFVRGSGVCQECGTALRRNNFRVQLFEDAGVEKEVDIRKKVLKDYNKKEEDFATLREYNDYLEMVETIVFNLTYGIDIEETKRQIESYKRENHDSIRKNRSKMSRDEELLEALIEQEKEDQQIHRQMALEEERKVQQDRKKNKAALIDELMFSDLPADHILAVHKRELSAQQQEEKAAPVREKLTAFSTGIKLGKQENVFLPIPKAEEGQIYCYTPVHLDLFGPLPPQDEDIGFMGYLSHIRPASDSEMGGGYMSGLGCQRALQEAFCGLFFSFDTVRSVAASCGTPVVGGSPEEMQTETDWG